MRVQLLEALLLATGFSGALTLVWLARLLLSWLRPRPATAVHFSPPGSCTEAVVCEIAAARREVLLLAYGFTSRPVAEALVEAKLRGVRVEVILDHSNETDPHSEMPHLVEQGIAPLVDDHHSIAHNKVVVIDGRTVVTGSFNFITNNAETHNAENLVVLRHHPDVARCYRDDFGRHREHSRAPGAAKVEAPKPRHHAKAAEDRAAVVDEALAPRMTSAASEVFARLREQMAQDDGGTGQGKKAA